MNLSSLYPLARSLWLALSIWHAQKEVVKAVNENRVDDVAAYINLVDINKLEEYKGEKLRDVCRKGNIKLVKILVKKGTHVDLNGILYDLFGQRSADNNRIEIVKFLIDNSHDVDTPDEGARKPLHIACSYGSLEIVKLLIEKKADVNNIDGSGRTPLQLACGKGHATIIELLLENGADVNIAVRGGRPVDIAIWQYYEERKVDSKIVKLLISKTADVNLLNDIGHTLLYDAFAANNPEIITFLINHGADVNKANDDGSTPLHIAVSKGTTKEVALLLNKGAQVNKCNKNKEIPLHGVYNDTDLETVKLLLNAGAHVNAANSKGNTVLHKAVRAQNVQMVRLLLDHGADSDKLNESGFEYIIVIEENHRGGSRYWGNDDSLKEDFNCGTNTKGISAFALASSIKNRKVKEPILEAMNEAKKKRRADALGTVIINQSGTSISDICKSATVDTRAVVHLPYTNPIVSARSSEASQFIEYIQNDE